MKIYCCGCQRVVNARLTDGREVYPGQHDLAIKPYWKCDTCGNHVGCHHKTKQRTRPLGIIPTPGIRRVRQRIHRELDPLWKTGKIPREELYQKLADVLGCKEYHTANIASLAESRKVLDAIKQLRQSIEDARHG